ncbi:serine protease [Opitutus sp. ER46]|uniref:S1 family peptidase n=1 Tax=Opitutus sp. ER46 TaxID=2161864 RepID=UPI0011B243DD|nr:serine protease [Opitutus sp. ER46]
MPNQLPLIPVAGYGEIADVSDVPELRRSVFPLVFSNLDGTFLYHGSCFSVSYSGGFCTAMHVINDGFGSRRGDEMKRLGAYGLIFVPGVCYGAPILHPFRQLDGNVLMFPRDPNPLAYRTERDPDDIGYDIARVRFALQAGDRPRPLWVHCGLWASLKEGDDVVAVGFNEALGTSSTKEDLMHYSDQLSACRLKVTGLEIREPGALGGGPIMTLNANIPPGFSGGPIFAGNGAVVGLVSTGIAGAAHGTGVWLEPYGIQDTRRPESSWLPDVFPDQCHNSQDLFEAWGVVPPGTTDWKEVHWEKAKAEKIAAGLSGSIRRMWQNNDGTVCVTADRS